MKTYLLTAAALGLAATGITSLGSTPAKAGPVCLTDSDSPAALCDFNTYAACQAFALGAGGECLSNPDNYSADGRYGYIGSPSTEFSMAYNRYGGPIYRGGSTADDQ
jgi:hypothetical protein